MTAQSVINILYIDVDALSFKKIIWWLCGSDTHEGFQLLNFAS
jgi:hypothetical protein